MAQIISQFGLNTSALYNDDGSVSYPIRSGGEVVATAARIGGNGNFEINSPSLSIKGEVRTRMRHNGGVLWFVAAKLSQRKPTVQPPVAAEGAVSAKK